MVSFARKHYSARIHLICVLKADLRSEGTCSIVDLDTYTRRTAHSEHGNDRQGARKTDESGREQILMSYESVSEVCSRSSRFGWGVSISEFKKPSSPRIGRPGKVERRIERWSRRYTWRKLPRKIHDRERPGE